MKKGLAPASDLHG